MGDSRVTLSVVGGGNMGAALVAGIIAEGAVTADAIVVVEASEERRAALAGLLPGVTVSADIVAAESAVIAVPDTLRGEVIESFVVLAEGVAGNEALVTELQQWVKKRFAAHAYPRAIHFVDALPKTPSGKIQRFQLKKQRIAELT